MIDDLVELGDHFVSDVLKKFHNILVFVLIECICINAIIRNQQTIRTNALIQFGVPGETYNVGTGKAIEIRSLLDKIIELSSAKIDVEVDKAKLRPVDVPVIEPDMTKMYKATGWTPAIPLEQTIKDMLDHYRCHDELLKD